MTLLKYKILHTPALFWLILAFAIFHAIPFTFGYRLTADDVEHHWVLMNGIGAVIEYVAGISASTGRIVHYVDHLTTIPAAYFADHAIARYLFVALFISNFFLFSFYISKCFALPLFYYISFTLLLLHPLDYFHTSPTAYPLRISFPVFLILVARIKLLKIRSHDQDKKYWAQLPWLLIFFVALMFSEYAFLFGVGVLALEHVGRSLRAQAFTPGAAPKLDKAHHKFILLDSIPVFAFVFLYLAFRLVNPSSYDGNQLPDQVNLFLFGKTLVGHLIGGTTFSSFLRLNPISAVSQMSTDPAALGGAFATFCIAFLVSMHLLRTESSLLTPRKSMLGFVLAACCLLGLAVLITTPVALTTKYQSWCTSIPHCVFLDSSLSFFGFGAFTGITTLLIFTIFFKNVFWGRYLFATVISTIAMLGYANNIAVSHGMRAYVSAWERAQTISCLMNSKLVRINSFVDSIEPGERISMHPSFDREAYWTLYVSQQRDQMSLTQCSWQLGDLIPVVGSGQTIVFGSDIREVMQIGLESNTAYIFPNDDLWRDSTVGGALFLYMLQDYVVLTRSQIPGLAVGTFAEASFEMSLSAFSGISLYRVLGDNWDNVEAWGGVWSLGEQATISIPVRLMQSGEVALRLVSVSAHSESGISQVLTVTCPDGSPARTEDLDRFVCTVSIASGRSISVQVDALYTPQELGINGDSRRLGVSLHQVQLTSE